MKIIKTSKGDEIQPKEDLPEGIGIQPKEDLPEENEVQSKEAPTETEAASPETAKQPKRTRKTITEADLDYDLLRNRRPNQQ